MHICKHTYTWDFHLFVCEWTASLIKTSTNMWNDPSASPPAYCYMIQWFGYICVDICFCVCVVSKRTSGFIEFGEADHLHVLLSFLVCFEISSSGCPQRGGLQSHIPAHKVLPMQHGSLTQVTHLWAHEHTQWKQRLIFLHRAPHDGNSNGCSLHCLSYYISHGKHSSLDDIAWHEYPPTSWSVDRVSLLHFGFHVFEKCVKRNMMYVSM